MTGNAALITDGGWCVGPDGAARTLDGAGQAPCGCGASTPCCNGLRICVPVGVVPGEPNPVAVYRSFRETNTGLPDVFIERTDVLNIGCGDNFATGAGQSVIRQNVLADKPSLPGLRRWDYISTARPGGTPTRAWYRPDAQWWDHGVLNTDMPSRTFPSGGGSTTETGLMNLTPCATGMTFDYTRTRLSAGETTVYTLRLVVDIQQAFSPCSGADCADCDNSDLEPA